MVKQVKFNTWRSALLVAGGLFLLSSCDDGCVTCTGVSADREVCKGDYQDASDYDNYINAYEEQGGVCE
jgi:hypothetical protein